MPHTGKPSTGCAECKKRRVKCDEQEPACGRCVRAQRACPGYARGLDLVLRMQNQTAKTAVEKRELISKLKRGDDISLVASQPPPRSSLSSSSSGSPASSPEPLSLSNYDFPDSSALVLARCRSSPSTPMYRTLSPTEDSVAVPFLMKGYVDSPTGSSFDHGGLQRLPQLWQQAEPGSPIALATIATGRLLFNAWERGIRDPEQPRVKIAYGRALSAIRAALEHPVRQLEDDTLAAVCLLGFYETISEAFRSKVSSTRHFDGAMALFQHRWRQGVASDLSKELFSSTRYNIISRAMVSGTTMHTCEEMLQNDELDLENPYALLNSLCVEVVAVLALDKDLVARDSSGEDVAAEFDELLARAQICDSNLALWADMLPAEFRPISLPIHAVPLEVVNMGVYGDSCDIYGDLLQSRMWNDWRCARLRVLAIISRLDEGEDGQEAALTVQTMVDGICASIPFTLGSCSGPKSTLFDQSAVFPFLKSEAELSAHRVGAAAFGGWNLFTPFIEMLKVGFFLRAGQVWWIIMQFKRLGNIYRAPQNSSYDFKKVLPEFMACPQNNNQPNTQVI